jgi:ribosomal 30S subunit maturation factor RimM
LSLIPAIKEFVVRVDIKKKKIIVHLIDGLVEE